MQSTTEIRDRKLFMGRFGPQALASIVFSVIELSEHPSAVHFDHNAPEDAGVF